MCYLGAQTNKSPISSDDMLNLIYVLECLLIFSWFDKQSGFVFLVQDASPWMHVCRYLILLV